MTGDETRFSRRADELRHAFDRSFAEAPRLSSEALVDLLAVRIAGEPYALRLAEVAGLYADRTVTPLPTPVPELLGLVGFRATLAPVYDLRLLLGYPGVEAPRWMVSTAGESTLALAFDAFEAHVRVARSSLAADDTHARGHVRQVARTPDGVRPVLFLPSVLEAIKARAQSAARPKER